METFEPGSPGSHIRSVLLCIWWFLICILCKDEARFFILSCLVITTDRIWNFKTCCGYGLLWQTRGHQVWKARWSNSRTLNPYRKHHLLPSNWLTHNVPTKSFTKGWTQNRWFAVIKGHASRYTTTKCDNAVMIFHYIPVHGPLYITFLVYCRLRSARFVQGVLHARPELVNHQLYFVTIEIFRNSVNRRSLLCLKFKCGRLLLRFVTTFTIHHIKLI